MSYNKPTPCAEHISDFGLYSEIKWQFLDQQVRCGEIISTLSLFFHVLYAEPILLALCFIVHLQAKRDKKKNPQILFIGAANVPRFADSIGAASASRFAYKCRIQMRIISYTNIIGAASLVLLDLFSVLA